MGHLHRRLLSPITFKILGHEEWRCSLRRRLLCHFPRNTVESSDGLSPHLYPLFFSQGFQMRLQSEIMASSSMYQLGHVRSIGHIGPWTYNLKFSRAVSSLFTYRSFCGVQEREESSEGEMASVEDEAEGRTCKIEEEAEERTSQIEAEAEERPGMEDEAEKRHLRMDLDGFLERAEIIGKVFDIVGKMTWCTETEDALEQINVKFETGIVTQILRNLSSCDVALSLFNWLKTKDGFRHDQYTYSVMMNVLGKAGRIEELQALFEEMRNNGVKITVTTCTNYILWLGRVKNIEAVTACWEQMKKEGLKPTAASYTAMIDFLAKAKQYQGVADVYVEMLREGILPTARTFTTFMQHLVNAGKLNAAYEILRLMKKIKVTPNRVTFEVLIGAYARKGDTKMAIKLINSMREHFHRPSPKLSFVVKVLQDSDRSEEASMLAEDIGSGMPAQYRKHDILPSSGKSEDGYACGENADGVEFDDFLGEWRIAELSNRQFDLNAFAQLLQAWNPSVVDTLKRANIQWNNYFVLEVLRRLSTSDTAWRFFHWVKDEAGFKHDSHSCMLMIHKILVTKASFEKKLSLVESFFSEMGHDKIKLTVPMFNIVIRFCVRSGKIKAAMLMFSRIRECGLEPNEASFDFMIQGLAKDRNLKGAMELFEEMQQAGLQPDADTLIELILGLGLAGKIESSYSLFRKLSELGIIPGADEYNAIMEAYNRIGNQKMALALYEEMRTAGIASTQGMHELVSTILRKANRIKQVKALDEQRLLYNLFGGKKKRLQESLLLALSLFIDNIVEVDKRSVVGG